MGMDLAERAGGTFFGWMGARKGERQAKRARRERMDLVNSMDWEPELASTNVTPYQKTNSPVARAYVESLLLGQNPDLTFSGETNADFKRAAQERTSANLYGTPAELAAKGAAAQAENPYEVTTPTRPVGPRSLRPTDPSKLSPTEQTKLAQNDPENQVNAILRERGVRGLAEMTKARRDLVQKYGSMERALDMIKKGRA